MSLLTAQLWLPHPPEEVFPFFADAHNLQHLTPPWMHFAVLTPPPIEMRVGARIDYRLRVHGAPIRWQSVITAWEPPHRFVDEQARGPYRRWRHEHAFLADADGTWAQDRVEYGVPGGWLVDRLLVARDLRRIFQFRQQELIARLAPGSSPALTRSYVRV